MAFETIGGVNPYTKLDRQTVIGHLKATGSRDPDVIHARLDQLKSTPKYMLMVGKTCLVVGILASLTVFLAIVGVPVALFGWWMIRMANRNIEAIDAAGREYMASPPPAKAGVIG